MFAKRSLRPCGIDLGGDAKELERRADMRLVSGAAHRARCHAGEGWDQGKFVLIVGVESRGSSTR